MEKDKKGKDLYEILKGFDAKRSKYIDHGEIPTDEEIGKIFRDECAKELLFGGCFLIGNGDDRDKVRLYLTDIELYYHEEKAGGIKDYVMYHIPERYKNKINRNKGEKQNNEQKNDLEMLRYFDLGTLNFHTSGIDITFENNKHKDDEYRASFLIRGYRIVYSNDKFIEEKDHPTHIYDDLFPYGIPVNKSLSMEWQDNEIDVSEKHAYSYPRKNVPEFEEKNNSNGEITYEKKMSQVAQEGYFKVRKDLYYKQCQRQWRFRIETLPESNHKDSTK